MRIYFAIIISLTICINAFGQPSINTVTGTVGDGETVIITGSGFGTKNPVAPLAYFDFNVDLSISTLSRSTSFGYDDGPCVLRTSTGGVGGSGGAVTNPSVCIDGPAESGDKNTAANYVTLPVMLNPLGGKIYIYRQRNYVSGTKTNLKSLELNKDAAAVYYGDNDIIYNESSNQWITQGITPSSYYYIGGTMPSGWHSEELIAQVGENYGDNFNRFDWYGNATLLQNMTGKVICGAGDSSDQIWAASILYHGDYNGTRRTMGTEYFDNLYLDNTWQRVILGNAISYASSTIRQIQIPKTSWSDTTINVQINKGSFVVGNKAYLFVVDSNNNASSGHEVTIGNESVDQTAPSVAITTIDGSSNTSATYSTSSSTVTLAGTATDAVGVTGVTWANDRGGSGDATCTGCTGTSVTWNRNSIALQTGVNVITITGRDAANNDGIYTLTVTYTASDSTPPVLSSLLPTGAQTCTGAGVANITLSLTTNEAATCRMATTDISWASMSDDQFTTTGGTSHSETKSLACGQTIYTYYVRCSDASGNPNTTSETISFWITKPGAAGGLNLSGVSMQ